MPRTRLRADDPRYATPFPDWTGPRPLSWFLMENLLEARAASSFPTNGHGPDEEVNVYLVRLLGDVLTAAVDPRVRPGQEPRLLPPSRAAGRRIRAQWYRVNADHRLVTLGLFGRGDRLRRRAVPWAADAPTARRRDEETGRLCYAAAADLLAGRGGALAGLAPVLRRLAHHFDDYVHVLASLATRRLGLGAVLSEGELARLTPGAALPPQAPPTMDTLLDLVGEHRRTGDPSLRPRIRDVAARLGVPAARLGAAAG